MINVVSMLGTLGIASVIFLLYILARLSERFGTVIKMPPIYRYYYLSIGLVGISVLTQLLNLFNLKWLVQPWVLLLTYYLPFSLGVTIGLGITWRYWHWLVKEERSETR